MKNKIKNKSDLFGLALSSDPDVVLTWDAVTSPDIYSILAGREGSPIKRNLEMIMKLGVDVTTYIHDPDHHWIDLNLDLWCEHLGMNRAVWDTSPGGGSRWISRRPFSGLDDVKKYLPEYPVEGKLQNETLAYLKKIKKIFKDNAIYVQEILGPMTFAYQFLGMNEFCMGIYDHPDIIEHLLEVSTRLSLEVSSAYASYPTSQAILVSDDIAFKGGLIFPPQFLREQLFPRLKRIYEPLRDIGIKCFFHSDGNLDRILFELVNEVEIDGLNPIERLAGMDPVKIRQEFPHLLLSGGIDTSHLLPFGTPGDVEREVHRTLSNLNPPGGYFVGSSNELHTAVPLDNAMAMYNAAHSFKRL